MPKQQGSISSPSAAADSELLKQIVQGLAGTLKGLRLYPSNHPAVARQAEELLKNFNLFFRQGKILRLGRKEETLFAKNHLFAYAFPAAEEVHRMLQNLALEGLEFHAGLGAEELTAFFFMVLDGSLKGEEFERALFSQQVRHIRPVSLRDEEDGERPREVYSRALEVVDRIFQDVRLGRIPSSEAAMGVVRSMVRLTLAEPHALHAMAMLKDYDDYTFTHSVNVAVLALAVGRACGLDEEQLRVLGLGGLLHDLGKLRVDRQIIVKPGRLTEREFEAIKKHPRSGAEIVKSMQGVLPEVVDIVFAHHMHYDREGYPAGARGRLVSPLADMTAIADTYDAITTLRSYQSPMTPRRAVAKLRELAGSVLHPQYVEHFIQSLGTYPVGTLVRLEQGEIGLVVRVGIDDPDSLQLKILFDSEGRPLDPPPRLDLDGRQSGRIVAEIDPHLRGIDITAHLDLD